MANPDALNLSGKIVTGDALSWQTSIVATIFAKGGGYDFPVKDDQKNLRETIATCDEPVFPLVSFAGDLEKAQGRLERRAIARLPANVAGIEADGPSVPHVCRVTRVAMGLSAPGNTALKPAKPDQRGTTWLKPVAIGRHLVIP